MDVCDMDYVAIALKQEQCYSTFTNAGLMWQPDAASYRKTQAFKNFVNTHLMESGDMLFAGQINGVTNLMNM